MATENQFLSTTVQATADYSGSGPQYHAFALVDGQLAANAEEASGILLNKPASLAFAQVGYVGEMKFAAGGAISKGGKITVTTSGWFIAADSGDTIVGEAKASVTSGSVGTGIFNVFPGVTDRTATIQTAYTPKATIPAGIAIALNDLIQANNGAEAAAVAIASTNSGTAADFVLWGIATVKCDPAKVCSLGDLLTVATSGYFQPVTSGYYSVARALANIGSDATGLAWFDGGHPSYKPA